MDTREIVSGMIQELRRGTIVLCVLGQLKEPMYGYRLVTTLTENGVPIEANTLYPLLRRLEAQGLLKSSWETQGPKPRKYYTLTQQGNEVLHTLTQHWRSVVHGVNTLLEEEQNEQ